MPKPESEHLLWLRSERDKTQRSIDRWSQPGATFGAIHGMEIKDGTSQIVESDRIKLADLDAQIAAEEAKSNF